MSSIVKKLLAKKDFKRVPASSLFVLLQTFMNLVSILNKPLYTYTRQNSFIARARLFPHMLKMLILIFHNIVDNIKQNKSCTTELTILMVAT